MQSGNFQDLTRVDCRILVTLGCKILVTAWAIRALHGAPTRARALTARWCRGELGDGAGVSGPVVQGESPLSPLRREPLLELERSC